MFFSRRLEPAPSTDLRLCLDYNNVRDDILPYTTMAHLCYSRLTALQKAFTWPGGAAACWAYGGTAWPPPW